MDVEGEGGREGVERIMYCHSGSWCFFFRVLLFELVWFVCVSFTKLLRKEEKRMLWVRDTFPRSVHAMCVSKR